MKNVNSASLVRYNANNRGISTGDCVKRAISYAFNKSYNVLLFSQTLGFQESSSSKDMFSQ